MPRAERMRGLWLCSERRSCGWERGSGRLPVRAGAPPHRIVGTTCRPLSRHPPALVSMDPAAFVFAVSCQLSIDGADVRVRSVHRHRVEVERDPFHSSFAPSSSALRDSRSSQALWHMQARIHASFNSSLPFLDRLHNIVKPLRYRQRGRASAGRADSHSAEYHLVLHIVLERALQILSDG